MTQIDEYNKLKEENYKRKIFELLISYYLKLSSSPSSLASFALCLMKRDVAPFIDDEIGLESILILQSWKFWNPSRIETAVAMKSAKGEYFFFSLSETWEEKKFSLLSHSPRCLQSKVVDKSRQILLFTTFFFFFYY